jgi:ubiquinone/menaquinone biosynthesis C-methylase UbiE
MVDRLDVQPGDRVLEIGHGGRLTAIDRSPKMIDAAARRNAAYVEAGIAEFLVMELENMNLGTRRFDKAFAARVRLFHRDPDRARALVEPWLAPSGTMLAVFDEPA